MSLATRRLISIFYVPILWLRFSFVLCFRFAFPSFCHIRARISIAVCVFVCVCEASDETRLAQPYPHAANATLQPTQQQRVLLAVATSLPAAAAKPSTLHSLTARITHTLSRARSLQCSLPQLSLSLALCHTQAGSKQQQPAADSNSKLKRALIVRASNALIVTARGT